MVTKTPRRLEYHDRVALQQADQAIRKDTVRALVELITNSNDSYDRLENNGMSVQGKIIVEIQRKVKNAIILVRDYAEGMSGDTMNQKVGTYGAPTSGFMEGKSVRGLWGRGLKDSFYGLGHGKVISIFNNMLYEAALFIDDAGSPMYEPPGVGIPVTPKIREKLDILEGNGTVIEIILSRKDVPVPRVDSLRFKLQQHFELRTIMNNPNRDIILRELNRYSKVKQEIPLIYRDPVGIRIFNEAFYVPGSSAMAHLEVFRSDEPLTSVSEAGAFADGGLLVISKKVVLALTLLKFEHNEYASHVYGSITCDYLHDLLQREETEPILTATRDGLNWDHPFMRALRYEVEKKLEPLIQAERRLALQTATVVEDVKLRKRFNNALRRLNSIANLVLVGPKREKTDKGLIIPFNGFGFTREFGSVQTGHVLHLTVRAELKGLLEGGSIVEVASEHPEVRILTPYVNLEARKDFPEIGEAKVELEGTQVGAESIITAKSQGFTTEALIKVVSKPPISEKERPRGFVTDIEFSASADPRQRAIFDRESAKIIISTRAASVALYLGENGMGANTPQGQVFLAELVTDVLCQEVARVGVLNGKLPSLHDDLSTSIQAHYHRLVHEFAHEIHAYFVDFQYRQEIQKDDE